MNYEFGIKLFLTDEAYSTAMQHIIALRDSQAKEAGVSTQTSKKPSVDDTRLGDYAAMQPLSGISRVDETTAVNGNGRGGFVRVEESPKARKGA
jgi:hypothetical protein